MIDVSLNGGLLAQVDLRKSVRSGHMYFNLPVGSNRLAFIFDALPEPLSWDLQVGDVVELRVDEDHSVAMKTGLSGPRIKGSRRHLAPCRFEVALNGTPQATVGIPSEGGLSVDLYLGDLDDSVSAIIHATASDEVHMSHWAFPLLQPGDRATITVLGAGVADEPGMVETR